MDRTGAPTHIKPEFQARIWASTRLRDGGARAVAASHCLARPSARLVAKPRVHRDVVPDGRVELSLVNERVCLFTTAARYVNPDHVLPGRDGRVVFRDPFEILCL